MEPKQKIQVLTKIQIVKSNNYNNKKKLCHLLPPGKLQGIFISMAIWSAGSRSVIFDNNAFVPLIAVITLKHDHSL